MAVVLVGLVAWWMVKVAVAATWVVKAPGAAVPTTYGIGNAFLTDYALPYELASLVLLVALIGAVVVSRKEIRG
jgi:NADH-quinone oxidoreductase subunit J